MKICLNCKHNDDQNPMFPSYYSAVARAWQKGSVPEFRCLRHPGTTHYRGDYCPDHTDNFREQSDNVQS